MALLIFYLISLSIKCPMYISLLSKQTSELNYM